MPSSPPTIIFGLPWSLMLPKFVLNLRVFSSTLHSMLAICPESYNMSNELCILLTLWIFMIRAFDTLTVAGMAIVVVTESCPKSSGIPIVEIWDPPYELFGIFFVQEVAWRVFISLTRWRRALCFFRIPDAWCRELLPLFVLVLACPCGSGGSRDSAIRFSAGKLGRRSCPNCRVIVCAGLRVHIVSTSRYNGRGLTSNHFSGVVFRDIAVLGGMLVS